MTIPRHTIRVHLPPGAARAIPVEVRPGLAKELPRLVRSAAGAGTPFVICDATVARLYGRKLQRALASAGLPAILIQFPAGEESKNSSVLSGIQTALLEGGIRRDSLVLALGGGVTGDLAGFAAATILRGVRFVQIPTTLLAQVDSSTGGKVGIDHPLGKNLIGAFHQPAAVWIDPEFLKTLPRREFLNGIAEVIKIAVALDADFVRILERNPDSFKPDNLPFLARIISRSVGLKAAVVERDEKESGLRRSLNLGHTIGHGVEAASRYGIPHGFAVSIGLAAEAEAAVRLGMMTRGERERVVRLLREFGLPVAIPSGIDWALFWRAVSIDKKGSAAGTRFALPAGIGRCALGVAVDRELLLALPGVSE